jgi:hypothetical protein
MCLRGDCRPSKRISTKSNDEIKTFYCSRNGGGSPHAEQSSQKSAQAARLSEDFAGMKRTFFHSSANHLPFCNGKRIFFFSPDGRK